MTSIETIERIKTRLRRDATKWDGDPLSRGAKGALIGYLNKLAGSDSMRRLILYTWFRQVETEIEGLSTKSLSEKEWGSLHKAADAFEHEGEWMVSARYRQMVDQTKSYIIFKIT